MAVTPKTYPKVLFHGSYADYVAIETKDTNKLYVCTDVGKIFKGSVDVTEAITTVATKPNTPVAGKLYYVTGTHTLEMYNGSAWVVLSYPLTTTVASTSTDVEVPSAKAVYDFVEDEISAAIGGDGVVAAVEEDTTAGKIKVTDGQGNVTHVTVKEAALKPTWDGTTRVLTIPIAGENDPVTVNIGKDIFIDESGDNSYHSDTNEIWLTLNDGSATSDPTVIKIPVAGLVDTYTVADTASIDLTLNDHQISAALRLKADATGFTNALQIDSNGGAYVDLGSYATTAALTSAQNTLQGNIDSLAQGAVANNTAAIATLNGDNTTAGSVAKQVKDAVDALANGAVADNTAAAAAAQAKADQNEADIAALAAATTVWGTF